MSSAATETSLLKAAESGIAPKPETVPKRRLGLVVALALGATVATAVKSGVLARKATNLRGCGGFPLAVGDAVELQNLNAAPALNGKAGTVAITAIDGGITTVKMDGGGVRNVPSVKVKASGCPAISPPLKTGCAWEEIQCVIQTGGCEGTNGCYGPSGLIGACINQKTQGDCETHFGGVNMGQPGKFGDHGISKHDWCTDLRDGVRIQSYTNEQACKSAPGDCTWLEGLPAGSDTCVHFPPGQEPGAAKAAPKSSSIPAGGIKPMRDGYFKPIVLP